MTAAPSGLRAPGASDSAGNLDGRLLVEGDTCWRRVLVGRAAVLVDAAEYFAALRAALLKAERSIFILGWELHSQTRIEGNERPRDGAPVRLGPLLEWLLRRKPRLEIKILLWNHPILFSIQRELFPRRIFARSNLQRVEVRLDNHLPVGASHHEKLVIVDDNVAFCGGIDLTVRRWDTIAHHPAEPRRRFRSRTIYPATHDVQMVVDGAAAAALGERARDRWVHAGGAECPPVSPHGDVWPEHVQPDFEDVHVGIMRTIAALEERTTDVREIERATVAAIARAERFVYIENQYVTSKIAYDALSARMRAVPRLEAIVVTTHEPLGWLEAEIMGKGRELFMQTFSGADLAGRIHFVSPTAACPTRSADSAEILRIRVHAKVLIIDDSFMRIGSSNLNNRSMGFDTECDLAIEAEDDEQRRAIARIRNRLLAEHWGTDANAVQRAFDADEPLADALNALPKVPVHSTAHGKRLRRLTPWLRGARAPATRSVMPIERRPANGVGLVMQLGDPERAISAEALMATASPEGRSERLRTIAWVVGAVAAIAIAVVVLESMGLGVLDIGASLVAAIEALSGSPWRIPLILAAFVAGSVIAVPILAMIGATVLALGPVLGFAASATGVLLAASATFALGRLIGHERLKRRFGTPLAALERRFSRRGVVAVALIRKVPIAPFTVVNILIGAIGIRFRDFIVGTALGMIPGIAAFALVSDRVVSAWREPTAGNIALIAAAMLIWIGVVLLVQKLFNRHAAK